MCRTSDTFEISCGDFLAGVTSSLSPVDDSILHSDRQAHSGDTVVGSDLPSSLNVRSFPRLTEGPESLGGRSRRDSVVVPVFLVGSVLSHVDPSHLVRGVPCPTGTGRIVTGPVSSPGSRVSGQCGDHLPWLVLSGRGESGVRTKMREQKVLEACYPQ